MPRLHILPRGYLQVHAIENMSDPSKLSVAVQYECRARCHGFLSSFSRVGRGGHRCDRGFAGQIDESHVDLIRVCAAYSLLEGVQFVHIHSNFCHTHFTLMAEAFLPIFTRSVMSNTMLSRTLALRPSLLHFFGTNSLYFGSHI